MSQKVFSEDSYYQRHSADDYYVENRQEDRRVYGTEKTTQRHPPRVYYVRRFLYKVHRILLSTS